MQLCIKLRLRTSYPSSTWHRISKDVNRQSSRTFLAFWFTYLCHTPLQSPFRWLSVQSSSFRLVHAPVSLANCTCLRRRSRVSKKKKQRSRGTVWWCPVFIWHFPSTKKAMYSSSTSPSSWCWHPSPHRRAHWSPAFAAWKPSLWPWKMVERMGHIWCENVLKNLETEWNILHLTEDASLFIQWCRDGIKPMFSYLKLQKKYCNDTSYYGPWMFYNIVCGDYPIHNIHKTHKTFLICCLHRWGFLIAPKKNLWLTP